MYCCLHQCNKTTYAFTNYKCFNIYVYKFQVKSVLNKMSKSKIF